jgi:hypothetical protein
VTRYEVLALLGAVVAGAAVVLIRVLSRTEHASTIYASQCIWSFLAGLPLGLKPLAEVTPMAAGVLVVASILVSVGQLASDPFVSHLVRGEGFLDPNAPARWRRRWAAFVLRRTLLAEWNCSERSSPWQRHGRWCGDLE